jgi:hypothetical protein
MPVRGAVGVLRGTVRAALVLLLAVAGAVAAPAGTAGALPEAGPEAQGAPAGAGLIGPFTRGAVVALKGTPHLWFADDSGVLHWGGDTRALAGREVRWDRRAEVTLDELLTLPRGGPWLSTTLVQAGEPIYFAKWESSAPAPTLLRVQSIADLELFGIDGTNYNALVLDRGAWEQRTGLKTEALAKGELAPAVAGGAGAGARLEAWQTYASAEGRYGALLPRGSFEVPLDEVGAPRVETALGPISGRLVGYGAMRPAGIYVYVLGHFDLPEALAAPNLTPDEVTTLLSGVRDGYVGQGSEQVVAERPVSLGVYPGREFVVRGQGSERPTTVRVYLVKGRLYLLVAGSPGGAGGGSGAAPPEVAVFLDSFRLTG